MSDSEPVRRVNISPGAPYGITGDAVLDFYKSQEISIVSLVAHPNSFTVEFSRNIEPNFVIGFQVINNEDVLVLREPSDAKNSPYGRATGSSSSTINQPMRLNRQHKAQMQTGPNPPYAYQQGFIPQTNKPPLYPNNSAVQQTAPSPMNNFQLYGKQPSQILQPRLTKNPRNANLNQGGGKMQYQFVQQRGQFDSRGAAQAQMSANPLVNPNYNVRGAQFMPMQQTRGSTFLKPPPYPSKIQPQQDQFTKPQLNQAPPHQTISAKIQPAQDQSSQPPSPTHHQTVDDYGPSGSSPTNIASGNTFQQTQYQAQTPQVQRTQGQPQLTELKPTQPQSLANQHVDDVSGAVSENVTTNEVQDESDASSIKKN